MKKTVLTILATIFAVAFIVSAVYLGFYFAQSKREADRYNELSNMVEQAKNQEQTKPTGASTGTDPADPAATEPPAPSDGTEILPCYQDVHNMNLDVVGWIKIDGTVVNYPVMQTAVTNRDYYLRRNYDQEKSTAGSIYAREECDVFTPSDNVTLYGHNMHDGSMFACLLDYEDKSVWENNSLITFDTLYEYHTYRIFAVFRTTATVGEGFAYHRMENAANAKEFNEFVATCKDLAFYDTGITPVYGDKLLCLSTCDYAVDNGRLVVAAVRVD